MTDLAFWCVLALMFIFATIGTLAGEWRTFFPEKPTPPPEPPPPDTRSHPYRDDRESRIATARSRIEDIEHELARVNAEIAALEQDR